SLEQYQSAGRTDLADQERFEIALIETYMPEALPADELEALIDAAIAETAAASMRDMGKVMGVLKPRVQGRADMGAVSAAVKQKLAG
ncbi:MAG: GatB/YqeY domain-containing protein, partial [Gammaproteobacteria bacterium]|nr:GatB/YqeY domain-containing protein [Gammaproteobacteria bacterium]NIR21797.1 GatB/YqeY domain-containing protein [Gammaproteobacteria bacterium]NIS03501.1 GatB/YqeY domain-containing protein [Gammaproteobacteria bacterium]NIU39994.1 GatB/YqeY domain-containing protein [Gammaproteobacteria bacterium]NIV45383.1 GatB/YqeY domain-containing protein [Gammaproteobacteria bacterium]